ncbi:McrB family protein [Arcicella rigui]|uniref:AAA family ATPase n=1 Tax=Arcicella rigui TaxID=797020 RepID=A0ABU5QCD4_9BACT|nr:AAA family ATPase [Arcicella rigui]MEA5140510.1 AAA family ATPase [Arcicella rigui]
MQPILQLHSEIYDFLMAYHQTNPDFYFFPRRTRGVRNWENGYLMGGDDDSYLTIGLYKPSDRLNQTQTISIFIDYKHNRIKSVYLLITFRDSTLQAEIPFYHELIDRLKNVAPIQKERENKYQLIFENPEDWRTCLVYYLEKIRPVIEEFIYEKSRQKDFFIEELNFTELSHKISNSLKINESNSSIDKTTINPMPSYPLNQILYGPPGTGKTYSTVELAYKIIHNDTPSSYEEARNWYKMALAHTEDRQVEFITFHQNYSYEDFVMGIKPQLNEDTLGFREHKGIFFEICNRALKNLRQSSLEESVEEPTFSEVLDEFIRPLVEENKPIVISMKSNNYSFKLINLTEKNIGFEKQSGATNHSLSIKTIQDLYEGNREYNLQGLGVYYYPLIEVLKAFAKTKTKRVQPVALKNYVIIIDEINRANISRVFGELITLIEEDKRWGNEFETEVRLPDGVTKFTVPKNLYIIGTMNTADKSIALLDIALRRRFEFTALYPDSSKVSPNYKTFFESLNEQIIAKKGIDFTIGHSYFMTKNGEELDFVKMMNKKVIPLLNEYFYNAKDNKLVAELLEKAIAKAGFTHTIVPSAYQLLIQ